MPHYTKQSELIYEHSRENIILIHQSQPLIMATYIAGKKYLNYDYSLKSLSEKSYAATTVAPATIKHINNVMNLFILVFFHTLWVTLKTILNQQARRTTTHGSRQYWIDLVAKNGVCLNINRIVRHPPGGLDGYRQGPRAKKKRRVKRIYIY